MSKIKRYHFCSINFLNTLKTKKVFEAGPYSTTDHNHYAYNYLFHEKRLNDGNGMFFLWENPEKKGIPIQLVDESKASFSLLELEIPDEIGMDTDYDNWCSFIMDLHEADGDLQVADEICQEFGIENGLEGSYQAIFTTNEFSNIQTLVPYLKSEWIISIQYTKNKII